MNMSRRSRGALVFSMCILPVALALGGCEEKKPTETSEPNTKAATPTSPTGATTNNAATPTTATAVTTAAAIPTESPEALAAKDGGHIEAAKDGGHIEAAKDGGGIQAAKDGGK